MTDQQSGAQAQPEQLGTEQRADLLNYDISHLEPNVQAALRAAFAEIRAFEAQREQDLARLGQKDGAIVRVKMVATTTNGVRAGLTQIMERLDAGVHSGAGAVSGTPTSSHYNFQIIGTLTNDGPGEITHLALVSIDDDIISMPATSADHALTLLRERANAWEFEGMETVDLTVATMEQLNTYIAEDGDPDTNWVDIAEIWTSWPVGSSAAEESAKSVSQVAAQKPAPIRMTIEANSMDEFLDALAYAKQRMIEGDRKGTENDGQGNRLEFVREE